MDHFSPERYLSTWIREQIEQSYDVRVNEQSKLENLIYNLAIKSELRNLLSYEIGE